MTQEKLIDAITDLDSDILNRYFDMKADLAAKKKPKKRTWVKWASMAAACFCLVLVVSVVFFKGEQTPDTPSTEYIEYTATSSFYYEDDVCKNEIATITHKGFDDTSITLLIDKKTSDPFLFAFRGWQSPNSKVITNATADLIIYVNGEKVDTIPTAPGIYEVKIDYSKFALKCDELDPYMFVSDVGYFSLNNEGYKIDGIDGLPDLTMPE